MAQKIASCKTGVRLRATSQQTLRPSKNGETGFKILDDPSNKSGQHEQQRR
jgi:hypothetical protein